MLYVVKRDGHHETVQFDKITERINRLINPVELRNMDLPYLNLNKEELFLDPGLVAQKVVASLYPGITTEELDIESANICINLSTKHPSYSYLGGRILVSNLHKKTTNSFSEKMILLSKETNNIDSKWLQYVIDNANALDSIIDYNRDYVFDYFAFKTLEKAYLLKAKGKIIERPQDILLRTAVTLQMGNIELIKKTYDYMSMGYYTHASPTLFNSGTKHMQLSSCFVEGTEVLTMDGIKKIQDVQIGDQVCTHMGRFRKVLQLHKNLLNDRTIMELKVHNSKSINVTNNHKFWSITSDDKEPKWRSVDEMNTDCKIAMPSYKTNSKKIVSNQNILAYICGYFISNGYIFNNDYMFVLYFYGDHNINNLIESIIQDLYNITPSKNNYNSITYDNLDFVNEIIDLLGIEFKINGLTCNETINFNKLLDWDNQMIDYFVKGLFIKEKFNLDKYEYANNLYHILRNFGYPVYFDQTNCLHLSLKNNYIEIVDGVKFLKIDEIKQTDMKPEYVYTLGIDEDHSYNVEGLICQNCFLLGTNDDLHDIATTWNSCAQISKWAGGIGLHVSNIRGKDSLIHGTGGRTNGLVPFLKIFNEIARWIDQGGKRPGSIAIYLEPHHPDIFEFLDLRKNFGSETERARDLFLALWISDLFMKQVDSDGDWYLLSADECPNLNEVYGEEFEELYWKYVNQGLARKKVSARKLWMAILESQIETGMPYITYKDHVNRKCNQKNIGTIKSSNLCVHGDTKVFTSKGYTPIMTLENKQVTIWNGFEWSDVVVKKTGANKNLIRVNFSNGVYLDCTREHKFYIYDNKAIKTKSASELNIGDELLKYYLPEDTLSYQINNNKEIIPMHDNLENKLCWFEDYCLKNNYVNQYGEIEIKTNRQFLLNLKLMLQTIGVDSHIKQDTKIISSTFNIVHNYTEKLVVSNKLKFVNGSLQLNKYITSTQSIKVVSVEKSFENVDTYCFTEPKRHSAMFNGILTGQCNEITEYSDHKEYAVCNLASIALKSFVKPFDDSNIKEWIIYTKPNCKYCTYAKNYLTNLQNKFIEIPHTPENVAELKSLLGKETITFPQIFIKNNNGFKSIGGWSDLYSYYIGRFDFDKLYEVAYMATINLDKVIDINYYPVPQAKLSNMKHRPIGLGIQGLADALVLLRIPFDSEAAVKLNSDIMETIYMASVDASCHIAESRYQDMKQLVDNLDKFTYPEFYDETHLINDTELDSLYHKLRPNKYELENGSNIYGAYSTFTGSPFSKGQFQFDLWNKQPTQVDKWELLRERVMKYGTRNSLLTSLMPTASTSQILGNNECFEFFTNNIYTRKTQSGDFMLVNKYLVNDLINIGLWSTDLKDMIIASNGSIQGLDNVPQELKNIYKTMWEIKQVWVLKAAAARGPFVDQTQSMNIFMAEPDYQRLSSSHFWGWKNGLKTGMYYLRTRPAVDAVKFTINPELLKKDKTEEEPCHSCSA